MINKFSGQYSQANNPFLHNYERSQIVGGVQDDFVRYDDLASIIASRENRVHLFNKVNEYIQSRYKGANGVNPAVLLKIVNSTIDEALNDTNMRFTSPAFHAGVLNRQDFQDTINTIASKNAIKTAESLIRRDSVYAQNIDLNMLHNNRTNRSIYAVPSIFPNVTPYRTKQTKVNQNDRYNSTANYLFGAYRR